MKKIFLIIGMLFLTFFQLHTFQGVDANSLVTPPEINKDMNATLEGFSSFNNVVIFIRFNDEQNYEAPYDLGYYENMFNGVNQISLRDYYLEASYGKLDIVSEIVSSEGDIYYYTDIYDRSYYEPRTTSNPDGVDDSNSSQAEREHNLLKRAINEVDALGLIDPATNLDVNNDGEIDSVTFMVSGEDNGWGSLLWPHKWELYNVYNDNDAPEINGVQAYTYTFNLLGDSRNYDMKASVGVLAHETFHLLGAPDLYHYYDFFNLDNAGPWSLMDNSAYTPVHMLGYMKETYGGWIDNVTTITQSGSYSLNPLSESEENLLRIDTGYSNEYVYLEYRYQDGKYESTLPDSGLIIYRVDKDYEGNELGYANSSNGEGINEVFVFRPNIGDITEPITFPNDENYEFYGNLNQAAISNLNLFKEAGTTTSFILFHSDGSLMDITIKNVFESNGTISFDITMDRVLDVKLLIDDIEFNKDMRFIEHPLLDYEATLSFSEDYEIYFSYTDNEVDTSSTMYEVSIPFDATYSTVHLGIYLEGEFQTTMTFEFEFVDVIETAHFPYGNLEDILWYIPPIDDLNVLEIVFNDQFELELDYDYLYIFNDRIENAYTGTSLQNVTLDFSSEDQGIWIWFQSDEYLDEYYGVYAEIVIQTSTVLTVEEAVSLMGPSRIEVPYGENYIDLGLDILSQNIDLYDIVVSEDIDVLTPDTYIITYDIYEDGILIYTLTREIVVLDPIQISFNTIFDLTHELGSDPIDFDALLFNVNTNSIDYDVIVEESIDYQTVGVYEVIITVKDLFGFEASQSFEVSIEDSTAPEVTLNASVDTIYVGDNYDDQGIEYSDLSLVTVESLSTINTEEPGVYLITYKVKDAYDNLTLKFRYVHVVENNRVIMNIGPSLTTIRVGERFVAPDCYAEFNDEIYTCAIDMKSLSHLIVGDYDITYSVTISGRVYVRRLVIFVVAREYKESVAIMFKNKEEFL